MGEKKLNKTKKCMFYAMLIASMCCVENKKRSLFCGSFQWSNLRTSDITRVAMLQIKEQKVVVDELSNLRKNRVSKVFMRNTIKTLIISNINRAVGGPPNLRLGILTPVLPLASVLGQHSDMPQICSRDVTIYIYIYIYIYDEWMKNCKTLCKTRASVKWRL